MVLLGSQRRRQGWFSGLCCRQHQTANREETKRPKSWLGSSHHFHRFVSFI